MALRKIGALGKAPARKDPRNLQLAKYLQYRLPNPPSKIDFQQKLTSTPMFLNDQLGCCTISALANATAVWSSFVTGKEIVVPDSAVLAAYEKVGGYVPGHPNTDNGANIADVLHFFRRTGFGGSQLTAYAAVNPLNNVEWRQATFLFGVLDVGLQLPVSAQTQFESNLPWTIPPEGLHGDGTPGSLGGHSVATGKFTADGPVVLTWGHAQPCSWDFIAAYADECFAMLDPMWLTSKGKNLYGFSMDALLADLALLR